MGLRALWQTGIDKGPGNTIDIHGVAFTSGKLAAQVDVLLEVTVYLSADGIPGALGGYLNLDRVTSTLGFQLMKAGTAVGQPSLYIDEYLLRKRLGDAYLDIVNGCQLDLEPLRLRTAASGSYCSYKYYSENR
jgi:hypothetical protein